MLSRDLNALNLAKKPSHCPVISHLAFADDMVIFTNGSKLSLQNLMNFLNLYDQESEQSISNEKSCYVVGNDVSTVRCQIIEEVTYYQRKKFPIKYLGYVL